MQTFVVAALYKFVTLDDYQQLKPGLLQFCQSQNLKGTILLACEGINGTVAGSRESINALLDYLAKEPRFAGLEYKESFTDKIPFYRIKVKLKKEIVTLGLPEIDPNNKVGHYVAAQDWNALISDPQVLLIDTRNDYEYETGTFANAINPNTKSFRDFPDYIQRKIDPKKHKKVALFCTGGIRCEKATSLLLKEGFKNVYHLKGGILNYLEQVDEKDSLWQGECFVFDQRVTVKHKLKPGHYDQCHGCRRPISEQAKQSDQYLEGIYCPKCVDDLTDLQKQRFAQRQLQIELSKKRGEAHMGKVYNEKSTD